MVWAWTNPGGNVRALGVIPGYTAAIFYCTGPNAFEWELYREGNNIPIAYGKTNTLDSAKSLVEKAWEKNRKRCER